MSSFMVYVSTQGQNQAVTDLQRDMSCWYVSAGYDCHTEPLISLDKISDRLDTEMSASEESDQSPVDQPAQGDLPEEHGAGVMRMVYGDDGSRVMLVTTDEMTVPQEAARDVLCVGSVVSGTGHVAASLGIPDLDTPASKPARFASKDGSTDVSGGLCKSSQSSTSTPQQMYDGPASRSVEFTDTHRQERSLVCGVLQPTCSVMKQHHKDRLVDSPHKCNLCHAGFSSRYHLSRHTISHTGEKPFRCDICGSGFMSDSSVKSHKRIHTGEKPYVCDVCGVGFTLGGHLKAHTRRHTGEKPYSCEYCSKSFSSGSVLKRHTRIHTGERPYRCEFCPLGFSCDSYLQRHRRKHTGERPYKCDVCLAEFMQSCNLKIHKRTHTGEKLFRCDVCGLELAHKSSLKSHERLHTGEKPYVCDVCGVKFTQSFGLKAHKVIHTGEKPYKCDICGVKFTHRGSFRNHKKIHKKDNS